MGKGEYPFLLMFAFSLDINYLNFVAQGLNVKEQLTFGLVQTGLIRKME